VPVSAAVPRDRVKLAAARPGRPVRLQRIGFGRIEQGQNRESAVSDGVKRHCAECLHRPDDPPVFGRPGFDRHGWPRDTTPSGANASGIFLTTLGAPGGLWIPGRHARRCTTKSGNAYLAECYLGGILVTEARAGGLSKPDAQRRHARCRDRAPQWETASEGSCTTGAEFGGDENGGTRMSVARFGARWVLSTPSLSGTRSCAFGDSSQWGCPPGEWWLSYGAMDQMPDRLAGILGSAGEE
jgi:hypothetical protein